MWLADFVADYQRDLRQFQTANPTQRHADCRVLHTHDDLIQLFHLRRHVFLGTGARGYNTLNCDLFIEPCDRSCAQIGLFADGKLKTSLRLQPLAAAAANGNYADFMSALGPDHGVDDLFCTRFFSWGASPSVRDIYALFQLGYRIGLGRGARVGHLTCAPTHQRFFQKIGYTPQRSYDCRFSGSQILMRLELEDIDHLRSIRSPLCTIWDDVRGAADTEQTKLKPLAVGVLQ
ncbi:MAG: hypothetical protein HRU31_12380 [Rhodobacteraceae bacterium]|nr:hypothetical protein [Paracoccaceae bacterium]